MMTDYQVLIKSLILPLVINENEVEVTVTESEDCINVQVDVSEQDLGRVIGKGGKIANAIRTIAYAAASKDNQKVKVNIGQPEE